MTLARRLPATGLVALVVAATVGFAALFATVGRSCGDCAAPALRLQGGVPDLLQPRPPGHAGTDRPAPPGHAGTDRPAPAAEGTDASPPAAPPGAAPAAPSDPPAAARPAPSAAATPNPPAPAPTPDVRGAAEYVRAFYADLAGGRYEAAWPRLAADLRSRHRSFGAWRRGFATTVRQSTSPITATSAGRSAAVVTLTLTAVDRDACGRAVERHYAVAWRLEHVGGEWRAAHATARPLPAGPAAHVAGC